MLKKDKFGIILNPSAGRGRSGSIRTSLVRLLRKRRISFQLEISKNTEHARRIAQRMAREKEIIISVGGDGTINEVLPGLIEGNASLAILPVGSGNDFNKIIGIPHNIDCAIDAIINGTKKIIDVGEVIYWNKNREKKKRFFINTLGMGLDAEIALETKNIKYLRGLPLYFYAALKALKKHSVNDYIIKSKEEKKKEKAFFICIGNGCFEGGGFKILPDAKQSDSLLDICIMRSTAMMAAIKTIPRIISGTHFKHNNAVTWKSAEIEIAAKESFILHGDGEIFETETLRVIARIYRKKLAVRYPLS